jgi:hypothetical protein
MNFGQNDIPGLLPAINYCRSSSGPSQPLSGSLAALSTSLFAHS